MAQIFTAQLGSLGHEGIVAKRKDLPVRAAVRSAGSRSRTQTARWQSESKREVSRMEKRTPDMASAAARSEMQRLAKQNESSTLNNLERYVLHRENTFEAFRRLNPDSSAAQEALTLLDKARSDLAEFKAQLDQPAEPAEDSIIHMDD